MSVQHLLPTLREYLLTELVSRPLSGGRRRGLCNADRWHGAQSRLFSQSWTSVANLLASLSLAMPSGSDHIIGVLLR